MVDVAIKKVSERDGKDRFVLINATTREVVTVNDVSEATIRRYFGDQGASEAHVNGCEARSVAREERAVHALDGAREGREAMQDDVFEACRAGGGRRGARRS